MSKAQKDEAPALVADDHDAIDLIADAADTLARAVQHHLPSGSRELLGSAQCEIFLKAKQLENLINPRRLRPGSGNRRTFHRDPNRFPYDVVVDLTAIRDSFDNLLIAFDWQRIASEPAIAPHSPAGFVIWPKKDVSPRDVNMMLKAAARLKQTAVATCQSKIVQANPLPAPSSAPCPAGPQPISERLDAITGRMKKLMELVAQANAPADFGDRMIGAEQYIATPIEKARLAGTVEGQEILGRHRGKFRFGAVGRDAVKAIQAGEGIYGLGERLAQDDAREVRLIAQEVGLRETGLETSAALEKWARSASAMIFDTVRSNLKSRDETIRASSCHYYEYPELSAWMGLSRPILIAFGDLTEKAKRVREKTQWKKKPIKRREHKRQLTEKQLEALQIVGECKGNYAEAARRMGCDRSTVKQHYESGLKNADHSMLRSIKPRTTQTPKDRRGQDTISDSDDIRRG